MEKRILIVGAIYICTSILLCQCSLEKSDDETRNPKQVATNNTKNVLFVIGQINNIKGNGDFFELNSSLNSDNALIFDTAHDFVEFRNDTQFDIDMDVIETFPGIFTTCIHDIHNSETSIEIRVNQKLDDEDLSQAYQIVDIVSEIKGNLFGRSWLNTCYNYGQFFGNVIVDYHGLNRYSIIVNNIGIDYYDSKYYKLIIDIHTGDLVSISNVNN